MAANDDGVKFCPVIRAQCKDDCALMEEGECSFARGLNGLDNIGFAFNEVDPTDLASAVQFLSVFNDAPMLHDYGSGSIPVLHVGIDWSE